MERGESGSLHLDERPEGAKLMWTASNGEFDVAIFLKLDRFSRSLASGSADLVFLEEAGVSAVFVRDGVDTNYPTGKLVRP